jgi:hypothetical protein
MKFKKVMTMKKGKSDVWETKAEAVEVWKNSKTGKYNVDLLVFGNSNYDKRIASYLSSKKAAVTEAKKFMKLKEMS